MWRKLQVRPLSILWVQALVFVGVVAAQATFWLATWQQVWGQLRWLLIPPGLALAGLAAWICGLVTAAGRRQREIQHRLDVAEEQLGALRPILGATLYLNDTLVDAVHEEQVMDAALKVITELAHARGASFVPLDEWSRPLPAFTYGSLPPAVLRAWSEHLSAADTRQVCRACQTHHSPPGSACPLSSGPAGDQPEIHCLPIRRGERQVGMVNIYAPSSPGVGAGLACHLTSLMSEAVLAVEAIRLRNRELAALHQVRSGRATETPLTDRLHAMLDGLRPALRADAVVLVTSSTPESWYAPLKIESGDTALFAAAVPADWTETRFATGAVLTDSTGRLVGAGLRAPGAPVSGWLLVAGTSPLNLTEPDRAVLVAVAGQAAVLIAHERALLSHEYRAVIQERARLAREIHDGLAQTLAYLKLQASQMQVYLAQGNLARLNQVLKTNLTTLSDAYLDTRQAIDDLRLTPRQGLRVWMEQILSEFESVTGLQVERSLQTAGEDLSPEIQAQMMRIIQETLNNIRKHAKAGQVWVSLRTWNGDLVIEISDNGQGFSPEDIPALSRYGLQGMHERAELIGADFQVVSRPGEGAIVRLSLPIQQQEPQK